MYQRKHGVGLVDDHTLFREGIASLINEFPDFEVTFEANGGHELQQRLSPDNQPGILLLDVKMPGMNGVDVMRWLNEKFPLINVLALSMHHEDANVVSMIRAGAKGYMLKDANTQELHRALRSVIDTGSYYSEFVAGKLVNSVKNGTPEPAGKIILSDRETQFLQLVCTELTYKEIAEQMYLSTRTIEGYRDSLFMRLNCKNRIGLVLYAIKEGLYDVGGREG